MKLVLELDDELARKLEERAKSEGKKLEALVLEALERQFGEAERWEALERLRSFEGWELNTGIVDREHIYADRD